MKKQSDTELRKKLIELLNETILLVGRIHSMPATERIKYLEAAIKLVEDLETK